MNVRKATVRDLSRIAEIFVFVRRVQFYPIFQDAGYSFGELQVLPVAEELRSALENIRVYDDGVVKGFLHMEGSEIRTLYVDPFFQKQGVGSALMEFAKAHFAADRLWVLEKNPDAIRFYGRHGFRLSGEKEFEEDTTEYLLRMVRQI